MASLEHGASVALLSGDDVFAQETRPAFPDATFLITKTASGRTSGSTLGPASAQAEIRRTAQAAVARHMAQKETGGAPAHRSGKFRCELRLQEPAQADLFCQWPMLTRTGGVSLYFDAPSVEHVVRVLSCLSAMSASLR